MLEHPPLLLPSYLTRRKYSRRCHIYRRIVYRPAHTTITRNPQILLQRQGIPYQAGLSWRGCPLVKTSLSKRFYLYHIMYPGLNRPIPSTVHEYVRFVPHMSSGCSRPRRQQRPVPQRCRLGTHRSVSRSFHPGRIWVSETETKRSTNLSNVY